MTKFVKVTLIFGVHTNGNLVQGLEFRPKLTTKYTKAPKGYRRMHARALHLHLSTYDFSVHVNLCMCKDLNKYQSVTGEIFGHN